MALKFRLFPAMANGLCVFYLTPTVVFGFTLSPKLAAHLCLLYHLYINFRQLATIVYATVYAGFL